ncbi:hypothetical protein ACJRO7_025621 [Eucalyptus globulus]|uniref:RING-type E3 ubiquitin transferase n=1 Tax=Eucalyptus globulus TaxID=34317 RepID=A0ABD3KAL5_EUCGL
MPVRMVMEVSVHQREQREISRDEEVVCMPCKHMFHHECVVRWLNESNLCPLCRFQMPTRSGDL